MKFRLLALTSAIGAASALLAQPAAAQSHASSVFLQLLNVDGPATTLGSQNGQGQGSVGCGSGTGDTMAELDTSSHQDLYHFCSNLTKNSAAGWFNDQSASPTGGVQRMEAGLAPDEAFMQTDQAAALATLQVNNVSQRLTQIRLVRSGLGDLGGYAFERGQPAEPGLAMTDPGGLQAPQSDVPGPAFAAALHRGFSAGDSFLGIEGLSAFINGEYTRLDASNSSHEVGSDGNGGGFTLGIDKQLGKSGFLGLAAGYSYLSTDFNHDFGDSSLNDVTFSRRPHDRVAELTYEIGGREVGHVRCDGLVAATPVGSTGYNLANQGPILAWGVEGYVVSYISPHSLTARALVVAPDDILHVGNAEGREPVDVAIDGELIAALAPGSALEVGFANSVSCLAQLPGTSFYQRIREKFGHLAV